MDGANALGKRAPEPKAEGTNTGHEDGEAMACVGVRLTAQLGHGCMRTCSSQQACAKRHFMFGDAQRDLTIGVVKASD